MHNHASVKLKPVKWVHAVGTLWRPVGSGRRYVLQGVLPCGTCVFTLVGATRHAATLALRRKVAPGWYVVPGWQWCNHTATYYRGNGLPQRYWV